MRMSKKYLNNYLESAKELGALIEYASDELLNIDSITITFTRNHTSQWLRDHYRVYVTIWKPFKDGFGRKRTSITAQSSAHYSDGLCGKQFSIEYALEKAQGWEEGCATAECFDWPAGVKWVAEVAEVAEGAEVAEVAVVFGAYGETPRIEREETREKKVTSNGVVFVKRVTWVLYTKGGDIRPYKKKKWAFDGLKGEA